MLLTYVDESYTDDWFVMAALMVDGPAAVALTGELDRVAAAAAKRTAWRQTLSSTGTRYSTQALGGVVCRFGHAWAFSTTWWRPSRRRTYA